MKVTYKHLKESVQAFEKTALDQEIKGIQKYGQALDPMDEKYDWLEMAKEEIVDGFKYLHAERVRRDKVIKELKDYVENNEILDRFILLEKIDKLKAPH